jgi:hypothetical protein
VRLIPVKNRRKENTMKYKVLIEDTLEICSIAQLLFYRTKEYLLDYSSDNFSGTFDSMEEAKEFIKYFFRDDKYDEEFYKEDWTPFIIVVEDNVITTIERYNYKLEFVEEVY